MLDEPILIPLDQESRDSSRRSAKLPPAVEKRLDEADKSACPASTPPTPRELFLRGPLLLRIPILDHTDKAPVIGQVPDHFPPHFQGIYFSRNSVDDFAVRLDNHQQRLP
jgi:hypothetical protein